MNTINTRLDNFVTISENNSLKFTPDDMIRICKRENNPKRDFLFVNSYQGKHLHVDPSKIFSLYDELILQIKKSINSCEKVIVIGFAETATAISQYIAASLPNCIYYMQTTREELKNEEILLRFQEEHSHATQHNLYGDSRFFKECSRVIFVDDEISTGNTILNFIKELQKLRLCTKYSVASILNLQNDAWTKKYEEQQIECFYIIRGKIKDLNAKISIDDDSEVEKCPKVEGKVKTIELENSVSSYIRERCGRQPLPFNYYEENIFSSIKEVVGSFISDEDESALVLGTEEYMFTPMVSANKIQTEFGVNVQFHATTRSPIEASTEKSYAINNRYSIASCYDSRRKTYIYNLKRYDKVFIITDVMPNKEFIEDISSALVKVGCDLDDILIIVLKNGERKC